MRGGRGAGKGEKLRKGRAQVGATAAVRCFFRNGVTDTRVKKKMIMNKPPITLTSTVLLFVYAERLCRFQRNIFWQFSLVVWFIAIAIGVRERKRERESERRSERERERESERTRKGANERAREKRMESEKESERGRRGRR